MSFSNSIQQYLQKISSALKQGNATEHTHRPALKDLIESLGNRIVATNEPRRVQCGAPDIIVSKGPIPLGYIETKNVGKDLSELEKSEQIQRYLDSLGNFILTDYLNFRWYILGKQRLSVSLATHTGKGKFQLEDNGPEQVLDLLQAFITGTAPTVASPKELAIRMAALARLIRNVLLRAFESENLADDKPDPLHDQLDGFKEVLIHDLTLEQFADMYSQTICYGLFAARCNSDSSGDFTRKNAGFDLPKTNRFLLNLFNYIAGPELDERITWAVDDLAELLNRTDIDVILTDFGNRTRQEDPVVHFYETFLANYDPKLKEMRGVYYTPEPVVSYIVRSVNDILKTAFGLPDGLADSSTVSIDSTLEDSEIETHRVQILDPATGTGTFLYGIVDLIFESFKNNMGMWSGYVSEHLLPRLYGFELLMAPYAVAHMKLGIQLKETGYDFASDQRIGVFLTNTLEDTNEAAGQPIFTQWIADEASSASRVKKDAPVMVIIGNPPYSGHSANTGEWITSLLRGIDTQRDQKTHNYFEVNGNPLGERNPKWLNDDYVKFIRFAQWRIEQTGYGILAFVTNHGYLDNPTFRGMRQSLMETFDDIYILDLHGNSKKKERCPDGSKDENVFDIQQGVAIGIFIKDSRKGAQPAAVYHSDFWGLREIYGETGVIKGGKYHLLREQDVTSTNWTKLEPVSPSYLFIPFNAELFNEYIRGWDISEIMTIHSAGIVTARDALTIHWSKEAVFSTITEFSSLPPEEARLKFNLGKDVRDWKVRLAQEDLEKTGLDKGKIVPVLYRPFDFRYTYYTGTTRGFHCMPRGEVMGHMLSGENMALIVTRQTKDKWEVFATKSIMTHKSMAVYDINTIIPLYIYMDGKKNGELFTANGKAETTRNRQPNFSENFIKQISINLKMTFVSDGTGDLEKTFGPEDIFHYIYAVFYSPEYRERYMEFLKSNFPRIPLTDNTDLFMHLCGLGQELVGLHLMNKVGENITTFPQSGDNVVTRVHYSPPRTDENGRVWINNTQYFDGIPPDVWGFHVGGYQVSQKWLKDRKGLELSYDDLKQYQNVVAALNNTKHTMSKIDELIEEYGGWPLAFDDQKEYKKNQAEKLLAAESGKDYD